jgi:hypothetical protein
LRADGKQSIRLPSCRIYCRVSTDANPASARNAICARSPGDTGHHIVGVFKETASGAKYDRLERRKVMALAEAREIATPSWSPSSVDGVEARRISYRRLTTSPAALRSSCRARLTGLLLLTALDRTRVRAKMLEQHGEVAERNTSRTVARAV